MGSLSDASKTKSFPNVPNYHPDHALLLQDIVKVTQNIMNGRTNNTGTVTLASGVTTTVVTLPSSRLGQSTVINFMPTSPQAAIELAAGTMYVSSRSVQSGATQYSTFTITHSSAAAIPIRSFDFTLTG